MINANKINDLAIHALTQIAEQHGLKLDQQNAKSDFSGLTLSVRFVDPVGQKVIEDAYGIEIGKVFTHRGIAFKVVEYVPTRPKYPVIAARIQDGKRFKFSRMSVI
jgi:hypothetical protein